MSIELGANNEVSKLKLTELKKICKKLNLSTTGSKSELIARITENEKFTILQPGDEAQLLGDDFDDDTGSYSLTDSSALDQLEADATEVTTKLPLEMKSMNTKLPSGKEEVEPPTITGVKRPASVIDKFAEKKPAVMFSMTSVEAPINDNKVESLVDAKAAMSDTDRVALRANRFGTSRPAGALSDDKLTARAKRFGVPVSDALSSGFRTTESDAEKLKKRAERFGLVTSVSLSKVGDEKRKQDRLSRFTSTEPPKDSDEAKKLSRAAKFGLPVCATISDEEKLSKRKARFGLA